MKTIVKYFLTSVLLLSIELAKAQDKVESPSETSIKGRRELRKDERIKRHKERHEKKSKKKLEEHSDKSFIKKKHPKKLKDKREEGVIRKQ